MAFNRIFAVCLCLLVWSAVSGQDSGLPPLMGVDGQPLRFLDNPQLKALAVIFILPDCPIGNSYVPELHRLQDRFAERGVQMVLVHADPTVNAERARQHAREYQLKLPVAMDPRHDWVKTAGATIAPEAAVFSPAGKMLYRGRIDNRYAGLGQRRAVVTQHDLADAFESILAGRPIQEPRTQAVGCLIPELSNGK
jgi:hypothetical protein